MDIKSLTRRQLAECFGCTERTVGRWLSQGMPRTGKRYDLPRCIKWRTEQLQTAGKSDPNKQLERLRRHKADLAKLEHRRKAGELVERRAVTQAIQRSIITAKTRLLGIPSEIGNQLAGTIPREKIVIIAEVATRVIRRALDELAGVKTKPTKPPMIIDPSDGSSFTPVKPFYKRDKK